MDAIAKSRAEAGPCRNKPKTATALTDEQKVALQLSMISLDKAVSIVLAGREPAGEHAGEDVGRRVGRRRVLCPGVHRIGLERRLRAAARQF